MDFMAGLVPGASGGVSGGVMGLLSSAAKQGGSTPQGGGGTGGTGRGGDTSGAVGADEGSPGESGGAEVRLALRGSADRRNVRCREASLMWASRPLLKTLPS